MAPATALYFHLTQLQASLGAEYLAALVARGRVQDNRLRIEREELLAVRAQYEPVRPPADDLKRAGSEIGAPAPQVALPSALSPRPLAAVPRDQWPPWAADFAEHARAPERGVGDTVARVLPFASDAFKLWHAETFGVWSPSCQCAQKQAAWNARYPYPRAA